MVKQGIFISGTDTDCGKTYVALHLLQACRAVDPAMTTVALKPVSSGCEPTSAGLRNNDALLLQQAMNYPQALPYDWINPVALGPAIAPHIAAQQVGLGISVSSLLAACRPMCNVAADLLIVEGCGGWMCPLNSCETMADFAQALGFPVLLVVGLRLGCLNHALLTWQQLRRQHMPVLGWVANECATLMPAAQENIQTLTDFFGEPPLIRVTSGING